MNNTAHFFSKEPDFSIGKARRNDVHFVSDSHFHSTYEIYYLVSGTRRQFVNHTIYDMKKGDLILIPKGAIHKTTAIVKNQHTRYLINFSEEYVKAICNEISHATPDKLFERTLISVPESRRDYIFALFEQMEEEFHGKSSDEYANIMIKNYLSELFVFILRYNLHRGEDSYSQDLPEIHIQKAARFIYDNYSSNITLSSVASFAHMSESYFSKRFKAVTGLNFSEYLTETRLRAASDLLISTRKSVSEIAEACGFSDGNYFGDVFKKHYGISPNKYRKSKSRI